MKSKIILSVLFIVLLIIAVLVLQDPSEQTKTMGEKDYLEKLDSAKIDKLEIMTDLGHIVLQKEGDRWQMIEPVDYPADMQRVTRTISMLADMTKKALVSENPEKRSIYQVDSTGKRVKVYEGGQQKIDLFIGKFGNTPRETYVREVDKDEVLLVDGALSLMLKAAVKDWRDRAVIHTAEQEIEQIKYQYRDDSFTLARQDTSWTIDGLPADNTKVDNLLREIANFKTDFFLSKGEKEDANLTATVTVDSTQLTFYRVDDERYYVKNANNPQEFIVLMGKADRILKKREDLEK